MPYYFACRYIEQERQPVRYNIYGTETLAEVLEQQADTWNIHPDSLNRVVVGFGPYCGKNRPSNVTYIGVIEYDGSGGLVFREGILTKTLRKDGMREPRSYNLLPASLRRGELRSSEDNADGK